jgi:ABC-type siderophore export system fused ATPase/permease subunit
VGIVMCFLASINAAYATTFSTHVTYSNIMMLGMLGIGMSVHTNIECAALAILFLISRGLLTFAFVVHLKS